MWTSLSTEQRETTKKCSESPDLKAATGRGFSRERLCSSQTTMGNSGAGPTEGALREYLLHGVGQRKNTRAIMDHGNHMITNHLFPFSLTSFCHPPMSACLGPHIWPALFLKTVRRSPLTWELHQSGICHYESKSEGGMPPCTTRYQEMMVKGCSCLWIIFRRTGLSVQAVLTMPDKGTACVYNRRRGSHVTNRQCVGQ